MTDATSSVADRNGNVTDSRSTRRPLSHEERRERRARQYLREKARIAASNCKIEDCELRANKAAGMCSGHYFRWKRWGDPLASAPPRQRKPTKPCSIDDCDADAKCRTWCLKHYQRWRKYGDPLGGEPVEPPTCSVDDCPKPAIARDYCTNHYAVWRRNGDPTAVTYEWAEVVLATHRLPPIEKFWARVDKAGPIPDDRPDLGPCWVWLGGTNTQGYGQCHVFRGSETIRTTLAHRIAWVLSGHELIDGMHLDHLCRNHPCVNPGHIEQVTPRVNYLRGDSASARNARKTHCKNNHEFTPENTRRDKHGRRGCRACDAVVYRRRKGSVPIEDRKITDDYRQLLLREPCRYCGAQSGHADHFYPSSKRPGDLWWRLVPACGPCNVRKHTRCGTVFALLAPGGRRRPVHKAA